MQHPLFDKLLAEQPSCPTDSRTAACVPTTARHDPRGQSTTKIRWRFDPEGSQYNRLWLAQMEPVRVRGHDTGWIVIVQEAYDTAIGDTLDKLKHGLVTAGLIALGLIALVMAGLWGMAKRLSTSR